MSQGQGHATTYAQIIATELGLSSDEIQIEEGDTDKAPYGAGTWGSRSTPVGGAAAAMAARRSAGFHRHRTGDVRLLHGHHVPRAGPMVFLVRGHPWTQFAHCGLRRLDVVPPRESCGTGAVRPRSGLLFEMLIPGGPPVRSFARAAWVRESADRTGYALSHKERQGTRTHQLARNPQYRTLPRQNRTPQHRPCPL